jgi:hypothetical protein
MNADDLAAWFTGAVTAIGLLFAGYQVLLLRRQHEREREVEIRGVAVEWRTLDPPNHADPDGTSAATYEITAYNPGKLPVRDVDVTLSFPIDVRRVRYQGGIDDPARTLTVDAPVIAGGQHRVWRRRLMIDFEQHEQLRRIQATIRFLDADGRPQENLWGRKAVPELSRSGRAE